MSAKRYFLIVWLAFSAPWIAGTGIGVYAESQVSASDGPAVATVASLADHVIASAGQIVQMDSSRSADTVVPAHDLPAHDLNVMDAIFVLGPPLLLLIAYGVALLTTRLAHGIRPSRLGDAE